MGDQARITTLIRQLQGAIAHAEDQAIPPGLGWASSAVYDRIGRLVVLSGDFSKTGGTPAANEVMGVLPEGARPRTTMNVAVATQNSDIVGSILIQADGQILWRTGSTVETDHTYLDGIAFIAAG